MRTVKIEEYWPLIVKNTEEFGQIATAENPEFNRLAECIYNVLKDSFIQDATEYGVSRWENMLGLAVTPDMSLEERKVAILTYLSVKLPYTWRVLKQMLTGLLGEDNFEMALDNDTQTLNIALASTVESMREKIDELCARVIPQNLVIEYDQGLPIDYTRVEYLESTGDQIIITDYYKSTATGLELAVDCELLKAGASIEPSLCSIVPVDNGNPFAMGLHYTGVVNFSPFNRTNLYMGKTNVRNTRSLFKLNSNSLSINGVEEELGGYGQWSPSFKWHTARPLTLFRVSQPDEGWEIKGDSARVYRVTVLENGIMVRDFIPALDSIGAPCLYDLVSRKPFYYYGTGDFIYPEKETEATTYSLRKPPVYAQMTEHGIRRLYRVPAGYNGTKEEYAEQNGFKILVETPRPEEGYWKLVWHDREDCIELEWVETEPPMEEGAENE